MEPAFAVVGARLVDGARPKAIEDSVVLIASDGRIGAVGSRGELEAPPGTPAFDATGLTLMPGLIDGHVHLTLDKRLYAPRGSSAHGPRDNVLALDWPEIRPIKAAHNAQLALAAGVTTLRDCGAADFSMLALRDAIAAGEAVGPRILACGRPITTTAGHIYTDWGVDTADEMKKAVRAIASQRADFVKLVVSGGTTTPGSNITRSQYSLNEIQTAVDDAHRLGLPVVAHAISTDSIRLAAEAGVDTIEHCSWIGAEPGTTQTDDEAVTWMIKNGVRVDHAIIPRPYLFPDEGIAALSPEEEWWLGMLKVRWPYLHHMRERGVTVFLGTDAAFGCWPGTHLWPGFQDMARAMEILTRWGEFSPLEVIRMATCEAARALGLDAEIGTIEPGKRADLILVDGDPLADIRVLRKVAFVLRDGRIVADQGRIVLEEGTAPPWTGPRGTGARNGTCWELPA